MAAGVVDQVGGYPQAAVRRWRASDGSGVEGEWVGDRGEVEVQVQHVVSLRAQAGVRRRDILDVTRRALVA